jgi:drug/metabolite transporter (DMT)-like permease
LASRAHEVRLSAFALLALANLLWSGNWIAGRALRDTVDPITLNFWRWLIAAAALAPFALPLLRGKASIVRRHAGILVLLSLIGIVAFHCLVYLGLRSTTAVNAMLINSSMPLFIVLCSWIIEREHASPRQIGGMLVSLAGIGIILSRGNPGALLELELHAGDAWILLAMPVWGVYSVLLKRRPQELGGLEFLFVIALAGVVVLAPAAAVVMLHSPPAIPGPAWR